MANRKDVAAMAGVSVAMVSRALNNSGYVAREKRELIMAAIRELNYHPNPIAVSLKRNSSRQLLFYVRDLSNNYYMEVYKGLTEYALSRGFMIVISSGLSEKQVRSLMVDGIVLPSGEFLSNEFIGSIPVPVVALSYGHSLPADLPHVEVSVADAMRLAIAHLRSRGHRRIGYVSMARRIDEDPRQRVFIEEMSGFFGQRIRDYILGPVDVRDPMDEIDHYRIGFEAAREYLERSLDLDAVACFNDDMAIGFMSGFQAAGRRIPRDLSVMGIDGHWGSAYSSPPLTTVSLSPQRHGQECARLLIDLIEGRDLAPSEPIGIGLIERSSVGR